MLIEHVIKCTKDGLTITQRVGSGGGTSAKPPILVKGTILPATFDEFKPSPAMDGNGAMAPNVGSGPEDPPVGGGGPGDPLGKGKGGGPGDPLGGLGGLLGSSPVTIIGPIIFGCGPICSCEPDDSKKGGK